MTPAGFDGKMADSGPRRLAAGEREGCVRHTPCAAANRRHTDHADHLAMVPVVPGAGYVCAMTAMLPFRGKVLFLGYGAVARCTLPIFVKHVAVGAGRHHACWTSRTRRSSCGRGRPRGVRFVRERVTPENLGAVLGRYLAAGDLLIDLAWNIDCCEILAVVPRPRRAVRQHVGRGVGPVRRRRREAPDRADALLAAHEHPAADGRAGASPAPPPCWSTAPIPA